MSDNPVGTEAFNMSMRKFLKQVGVTSQQEIENAVRKAHEAGALSGKDSVSAKVTLTIDGLDVSHVVDGDIKLS
jgi:ribosomal protein L1